MADGAHPTFSVSLVTPDGPAFEGEAEMVIVPGAAGEIGVLARHAPLIAMLKAGSTRIHLQTGGEVLEDRAIALVDDAVLAAEVDGVRAQEQLDLAMAELERVDAGESTADRWQLVQRIRHAENMLRVSGHGS